MKQIYKYACWAGMALVMLLAGGCGAAQPSSSSDNTLDPTDAMVPRETGAIGRIEVTDVDRAGYTTFEEYVASHTAGVDLDNFGNLVIRGRSTKKGYSKPLIVYDGVETYDTSMINPYDIATIEVIKDGTASIYGMRGNGGVIIVTSKAKAGRAKEKSDEDKAVQVEINSKISKRK